MKNVDRVLVHPELGLWSQEANARVRDESRSLGYFLGLELKTHKVKSDNFNGIFFEGIFSPQKRY